MSVRAECQFDNNPLGSLCSTVNDRLGNAVVGAVLARLMWALAVVLAVLIGGRVVRRVVDGAMDRSSADQQVRTLVRNLLVATTAVLALLGGLTGAGLPLSVLLTFGGLTSLAIGLAFQDLLRNVLAGIFLLIERPFRLGDQLEVGDLTGKVETIELRTTALRLGDGRLAIIPNLNAFNQNVINASAYDTRQYTATVWVPEETDVAAVLTAARDVLSGVEDVLEEPAPKVVPALQMDGGVTLNCQYWLRYHDCDPDQVAGTVVAGLAAMLDGMGSPRDPTG